MKKARLKIKKDRALFQVKVLIHSQIAFLDQTIKIIFNVFKRSSIRIPSENHWPYFRNVSLVAS